jgi:hypothetical protein
VAVLTLGAGLGYGLYHYLRLPTSPQDDPAPAGPSSNYPLAAPPLRLRALTWDFGTALPGRKITHTFEITNPGAERWTLKHFTPSCPCTMAKLPSGAVGPGETARLELTYTAPLLDGKVAGHVMIEFAEPASPILQLTIQGEVRSLLSANPPSLVFDYAPSGTRLSRTVTLHNRSDRRVKLTHVDTPAGLRAEWRSVADRIQDGQPRQTWELTVHAEPDKFRPVHGEAVLTVRTDSEEVGPLSLPVRRQAPLEVSPDQLAFGVVEVGKTGQKRMLLRAAPALGELTAKDLVLTHNLGDELDVQVQKEEASRSFVVLVRFQPRAAAGGAREVMGELAISTHKDTSPPLRVKISATVVRAGPP